MTSRVVGGPGFSVALIPPSCRSLGFLFLKAAVHGTQRAWMAALERREPRDGQLGGVRGTEKGGGRGAGGGKTKDWCWRGLCPRLFPRVSAENFLGFFWGKWLFLKGKGGG